MKQLIKNRKLALSLCLLMLTSYLSGCSTYFMARQNSHNVTQLVGYIDSKSIDIPSESIITLSLTPMLTEENVKSRSLDYQFITKNTSRRAEFRMAVPKEFSSTNQLGISARVEKNNELIMMSNEITPISKKVLDKIVLTVISN
uniref:Lipoprotein n=1 Tax=Providencia stuartii TaxID=588 RepID=A0AAI9DBR6_PROST|nr:hypothetical protein [Providencia stuartii]